MIQRKVTFYSVFIWIVSLALLSACSAPAVVETAEDAGDLAQVESAKVEVGLGSPTPVSVTIDAKIPNACSQISRVEQAHITDGNTTRIVIEIRIADMGEFCGDFPQSLRMIVPINASGLPKGIYEVEVNGVDAGSFEFEN